MLCWRIGRKGERGCLDEGKGWVERRRGEFGNEAKWFVSEWGFVKLFWMGVAWIQYKNEVKWWVGMRRILRDSFYFLAVYGFSCITQRMNTIRNASPSNGFSFLHIALYCSTWRHIHSFNSRHFQFWLTFKSQNPVHSLHSSLLYTVVPCKSDE